MTCRAWENLLQEQLDGADEGRLEQHFQNCPECAIEQLSVRRLLDGMTLLAPELPPASLTERIVRRLWTESRQQRRLQLRRRFTAVGIFAVAAALLLAVGLRLLQPTSGIQPISPPSESIAIAPVTPAPGFRDSVAEASNAVASLTSRAASETMDQTASLFPLLPAPTLEPFSAEPPPIEPLREASASVSAGFAPVADSARRAVDLFLRDLPMGHTESPATK